MSFDEIVLCSEAATPSKENKKMSDNAAFYYVSSSTAKSGYKTLDEASAQARKQAARYGDDYTVFMSLKTFTGEPRNYVHETDLSFGVAAETSTTH
jgi:hypothetical protein